jgi:uncharacterized repeat protein (TIGR03803 family)
MTGLQSQMVRALKHVQFDSFGQSASIVAMWWRSQRRELQISHRSAGHLYGTTYYGGASGCGAVFKYTP